MRALFKLLAMMTEKNVDWCFQCQGKNKFYNISLTTPDGKSQACSSKYLDQIETYVEIHWGDLLDETPVKAKDTPVKPKGMPSPF